MAEFQGTVTQVLGNVVDVEFPAGQLPDIFDAVEVPREDEDNLILEVELHLGDSAVRTVAMDSTDGLARGAAAYATGQPIAVPVGEPTLGRIFNVLGRPIDTVRRTQDIAWFRFDQLCDGPRGAVDYIEIARCFHTVLLSDVPVIGARERDRTRRFISLVDELYDRRVNLVVSAAAPPAALYPEGRDAFEFRRTVSRLEEMQTREYLQLEHLG